MPRYLYVLSYVVAAVAFLAGIEVTGTSAARIEAVEGKSYPLTKRHGPWTIMVASFEDIPETVVDFVDGKPRRVRNDAYVAQPGSVTAVEAADMLVHELRKYGIPAYTYVQDTAYEKATSRDQLQRTRRRTYTSRKRNIAVLAGNYPSADDDTAQKTLTLVKKFFPEFLAKGGGNGYETRSATGYRFRATPGQPTPLSGAFLTINPLLTADEAREMSGKRNPLLAKLNTGTEHPLVKAKGKYTIRVATCYGRSTAHRHGQKPRDSFFKSDGSSLDLAAEDARTMVLYMRKTGTPAYVHHEQFRSIVTVGTFDSPDDPAIRRTIAFFSPKKVRDPKTGKVRVQYEYLTIPPSRQGEYAKSFPIDPEPTLIKIPRI